MAKSGSTTASVVAESVVITGRVTGDGDLEVRGRVDGEIDIRGELTLADGSATRAALTAGRVIIAGAVVGDINATESIALEATARVIGNLRAPRIAIALGAQIRGDLDMGEIEGETRTAARAAAPRAVRAPLPAARPVVVARKAPSVASAAVAPPPSAPARRAPPEPVVPAIKKGAKAAKKRG
jgi:cytoskeletal protein CcmA (bactofilin family)